LSGVFPSQFRLDITSPPPEATLSAFYGAVLGGKGKAAYGIIAMLPANHPSRIPQATVEETMGPPPFPALLPNGQPDPNWVPSEPALQGRTFTNCSAEGRCRVRKTECSESACPIFASAGPIQDTTSLTTLTTTGGPCAAGFPYCLEATSVCSLGGCHQDFSECDLSQLGPYDRAGGGHLTLCRLTEESGDPSLLAIQDLRSVATEYAVLFSTEEIPSSPLGPIKRGYNLMFLPSPSREDWVAIRTCQDNATVEARRRINAARHANYAMNDILPADAEAEEQKTLQALGQACPTLPRGRVVDNGPITIKVGRPPFPL
jgi:hypothetical protein